MRSAGAVMVAAEVLRRPALVRAVREAPLPKGMTLLLEVAAGDAVAIESARQVTGDSAERLTEASCFFVEQVLLTHRSDCYRILGVPPTATNVELRRHMALLMRWLHPDIANGGSQQGRIDRSVFVSRVTNAWQTLKSQESRTAYDASLQTGMFGRNTKRSGSMRRFRPLGLTSRPPEGEGLFSRLMMLLRGAR